MAEPEFRMRPEKLIEYAKMVTPQKGRNPITCIYRYRDHPNGQQSVSVYSEDSDDEEVICRVVPAELKKWHRMGFDFRKLYEEEVEYNAQIEQDHTADRNADIAHNPIQTPVYSRQPADPHRITADDFKPYIRRRQ